MVSQCSRLSVFISSTSSMFPRLRLFENYIGNNSSQFIMVSHSPQNLETKIFFFSLKDSMVVLVNPSTLLSASQLFSSVFFSSYRAIRIQKRFVGLWLSSFAVGVANLPPLSPTCRRYPVFNWITNLQEFGAMLSANWVQSIQGTEE